MLAMMNERFGVGPAIPVEVRDEPSPFIPKADEAYQFREDLLRALMIWHSGIAGRNLLIQGPTGAGKSSLAEQFCNRLRIPLYRVPCHARSEFSEFTGQLTVKADGSTEFVYGALPRAMREGAVLLFDEFNFVPPGATGALNTVLDGGPLLLPETGEVIEPHPDFRIAATGNAVDGGDDAVAYRGIQRMNLALIQRFLTVKVDYLSATDEAVVLNKHAPSLPGSVIQSLVATANDVRESFVKGDIESTLATRGLVKMARIMNARIELVDSDEKALVEAKFALRLALTDGLKPVEARAIEGVLERIGVKMGPIQKKHAKATAPKSNAAGPMIHLYVNPLRPKAEEALWGYVGDANGAAVFKGSLDPKDPVVRLGGQKTIAEARGTAVDLISNSGYKLVGGFEIAATAALDDYTDSIDPLLRHVAQIHFAAQKSIGSAIMTMTKLDPAGQETLRTYAKKQNVDITFA